MASVKLLARPERACFLVAIDHKTALAASVYKPQPKRAVILTINAQHSPCITL